MANTGYMLAHWTDASRLASAVTPEALAQAQAKYEEITVTDDGKRARLVPALHTQRDLVTLHQASLPARGPGNKPATDYMPLTALQTAVIGGPHPLLNLPLKPESSIGLYSIGYFSFILCVCRGFFLLCLFFYLFVVSCFLFFLCFFFRVHRCSARSLPLVSSVTFQSMTSLFYPVFLLDYYFRSAFHIFCFAAELNARLQNVTLLDHAKRLYFSASVLFDIMLAASFQVAHLLALTAALQKNVHGAQYFFLLFLKQCR
jgi:hypothetical protein